MAPNAKHRIAGPIEVRTRPAIVVAVTASALAGVIHVGAAAEHADVPTLLWLFDICAIGQLAWAAAVALRPTRAVLAAGIVFNAGAFGFWLLSRTTGIAFIAALKTPEAVETQDLAAALLALASVAAAVVVLVRPAVRPTLPAQWSLVAGIGALVLFAPVLATAHTHLTGAGHDHELVAADAGHSHDTVAVATTHDHTTTTDTAVAEHDHGGDTTTTTVEHNHTVATTAPVHAHGDESVTTDTTGHDHGSTPSDDPAPHEHPTDGPIISLDDPRLTPDQRAAAQHLIDVTRAGMSAFSTIDDVVAGGYEPLGDGGNDGYEHYVNWNYLGDSHELDPDHIEAIVVKNYPTGEKTIVSALYILTIGKTMGDVPDIAGELTTWHIHDNLCLEGHQLVGLSGPDGTCARGALVVTPPMLHVWLGNQACGPFAGIDENGVECGTTHTH